MADAAKEHLDVIAQIREVVGSYGELADLPSDIAYLLGPDRKHLVERTIDTCAKVIRVAVTQHESDLTQAIEKAIGAIDRNAILDDGVPESPTKPGHS